ncbi:MAG: iron chelate uptake ABC transporter family permease subunit [Candidatus Eisenbacteria bacterium]
MELVRLMAAPFAASVVLVLIHAYLGGHVLRRGVIFVDLAMAQFAALGAAIGLLVGVDHDTPLGYGLGLVSAFIAAALFSWSRQRIRIVPQEAVIGIAYVLASSAVVVIADRVPHGAEHIKHALVGTILWIGWGDVAKTAVLYGALGLLLALTHSRLEIVSRDPAEARRRGMNLFVWDFLFYGVFAFVVTSSVQIAGVLLVFTILIVPSVFTAFAGLTGRRRLPGAWIFGVAMSLVGMILSFYLDLPTGATVVVVFGLALFITTLLFSGETHLV